MTFLAHFLWLFMTFLWLFLRFYDLFHCFDRQNITNYCGHIEAEWSLNCKYQLPNTFSSRLTIIDPWHRNQKTLGTQNTCPSLPRFPLYFEGSYWGQIYPNQKNMEHEILVHPYQISLCILRKLKITYWGQVYQKLWTHWIGSNQ